MSADSVFKDQQAQPWKKAPENRDNFHFGAAGKVTFVHIFGSATFRHQKIHRTVIFEQGVPSTEMVRPECFDGNFVIDRQSTDDAATSRVSRGSVGSARFAEILRFALE